MSFQANSKKQIDIQDIYAAKLKPLWIAFRQEHVSLLFLVLYFLFEYVRPQVLYPSLNILPWAFLFMVLAVIAAINDKSVTWVSNPLNMMFNLFILIVVFSSALSYFPGDSWDARNVMLTWWIVYYLVICIVNTERRLIFFIMAYLLFSLKMSQHGVHDWVSRGFSFAAYGLIGSPGWFRNSGEYAIQMLIYGSLAIAYVISFKQYWGKYKKIIMYAAAATGYMAVIGASSRGAQLGLAAIIVWGVLRIRGGFKFLIVIVVLATVLYHLLPEQQIMRFESSGEDESSLQRLAYWKVGIQLAHDHPLLGIGYYNWMSYVSRLYPDGVGPYQIIQVPHSIYIQAAAELGYTGFLFFVFTALTAFAVNMRTRKMITFQKYNHLKYISYALDAGLIGFLIAGSFVTVLYYPFFWIQIAMIAMLRNVTKKSIEQHVDTPDERSSSLLNG